MLGGGGGGGGGGAPGDRPCLLWILSSQSRGSSKKASNMVTFASQKYAYCHI